MHMEDYLMNLIHIISYISIQLKALSIHEEKSNHSINGIANYLAQKLIFSLKCLAFICCPFFLCLAKKPEAGYDGNWNALFIHIILAAHSRDIDFSSFPANISQSWRDHLCSMSTYFSRENTIAKGF